MPTIAHQLERCIEEGYRQAERIAALESDRSRLSTERDGWRTRAESAEASLEVWEGGKPFKIVDSKEWMELEAERDRLLEYARHKQSCPVSTDPGYVNSCTCGFSAALAAKSDLR